MELRLLAAADEYDRTGLAPPPLPPPPFKSRRGSTLRLSWRVGVEVRGERGPLLEGLIRRLPLRAAEEEAEVEAEAN